MKRKRTLVPREKIDMPRVDAEGQMKLTDYFFAMSSPIRLTIMRFLDRAKSSGFGMQTFTGIQKALEASYHVIASNNLNHHLNGLKNVGFVGQEGEGGGYMILDLGHQILGICKNIEENIEKKELRPNKYEDYVYHDMVQALLVPVKDEPHVIDVPSISEERLLSPARTGAGSGSSTSTTKRTQRGQGSFSRLESFA